MNDCEARKHSRSFTKHNHSHHIFLGKLADQFLMWRCAYAGQHTEQSHYVECAGEGFKHILDNKCGMCLCRILKGPRKKMMKKRIL
jgi:hypothetical protein